MNVLGEDAVRPWCTDSHVAYTPKPVLCFGVLISSHIVMVRCSKTAGSLFFERKVVKWCTEYQHQKKTTRFLKNSDAGTKLSDSGTNIFFFSHESSQFLMMDV